MLKKLKLKSKLIILTVVLLAFYGIFTVLSSGILIKKAIYKEKQTFTRESVNIALGTLNYYYKMEQDGALSRNEAQEKAKATIKSMFYGENKKDYFFIDDYEMKIVAHPFRPDMEGSDASEQQDPDGVYITKTLIDVCKKKGAGFFRYRWQYYDDKNRIEPKLSYCSEFKPWNWIVCTGIYINDIDAIAGRIQSTLALTSVVIIVIASIAAILFSFSLVRPLNKATVLLKDIAQGNGDLTKRLEIKSHDEIGELSTWFNKFADKIHDLIGNFNGNVSTLSSASEELAATSSQIATLAEDMNNHTSSVASSTEESATTISFISSSAESMSSKVNNIAVSVEEMSNSIHEVTRNCLEESKIAETAKDNVTSTLTTINELGIAANSIGKIVDVINDIAQKTNLLALNATIEAATAGEAGKGFSVVANEVKELAKQTASATQDISEQIATMQTKSENTVNAIQNISGVVNKIQEISQIIFQSVSEQNETINEISKNLSTTGTYSKEIAVSITESAGGLQEITKTISGVSKSVKQTSQGVTQITESASELSKMASGLGSIVNKFKI